MSGTYVNTNGRSEGLNQAAAHDSGLYDPNMHDNQIVALYETMAEANAAREKLVQAGVSSQAIQVMDKSSDRMAGGVDYESGNQGMWGAIKSLFIPDEDAHAYSHAISRGHAMVVVSPARTDHRETIIHTLEGTNPIDFDAKLEEWRQSGYNYSSLSAGPNSNFDADEMRGSTSATVNRAASTPENYAVNQATVTDNIPPTTHMASTEATGGSSRTAGLAQTGTAATASTSAPTSTATAGTASEGDTIKVVQEQLRVGKREVAAGAVRVRSYIVERPVEEQVRLHEERIQVERRPVDRPVSPADAAAFQERTIEARATEEVPIVAKEARVVEEVGVRKEATERVETVRDTVRETKVDVENVPGATTTGTTTGTTGTSGGSMTGGPSGSGSMGTGGPTTNPTAGATSSGMNAPRPTK